MMIDTPGTHFGRGESIEDTARVLDRQVAAIVWRTFGQDRIERWPRRAGPGGQRAHRRVPPLSGPRRPADRPRAPRLAGRAHADLPGRRRQQHVPLLPARRGDRRDARPGGRPPASNPTRRWWPGPSRSPARPAARRSSSTTPPSPLRAPTCWPPTSGCRWAWPTPPSDRRARALPGRRRAAGGGRPGRHRAALPARAPRRGDHGEVIYGPARPGLGPGRTAACAEGPARLAAGAVVDEHPGRPARAGALRSRDQGGPAGADRRDLVQGARPLAGAAGRPAAPVRQHARHPGDAVA